MIISSIGSAIGRDYSTIALWAAACPADLVTANEQWVGELYNDSEFDVGSSGTSIGSGVITSPTNYIELRVAAGEGFRDNPQLPLRADAAHGVYLTKSGSNYSVGLSIQANDVILKGLQFRINNGYGIAITGDRVILDSSIIYNRKFDRYAVQGTSTGNTKVINSLIYGAMSYGISTSYANASSFNSTFYSFNAGTGSGIREGSGSNNVTAKNSAVANYGTDFSGTMNAASEYNASSDTTAPGTNSQININPSLEFEAITDVLASDFKLAATSVSLAGTGTPDATNTNNVDIYGNPRSLTAPSIGCYEAAGAPPATVLGITTEVNTTAVVNSTKTTTTAISSSSESATTTNSSKSLKVGSPAETNTVTNLTSSKTALAGITSYSESATNITSVSGVILGLAASSEIATGLTSSSVLSLGIADSLEIATVITASNGAIVGLAVSTEVAQALTSSKTSNILAVTSTETATIITSSLSKTIISTSEIELAGAVVTSNKGVLLGVAVETNAAGFLLNTGKTTLIGSVFSVETANNLTSNKAQTLISSTETNATTLLTSTKTYQIVSVTEFQEAGGINGDGTRGNQIPADGRDGPSVIYPFLTLPEDNLDKFYAEVVTNPVPTGLTFFGNGTFIWTDLEVGEHYFDFQIYKNGELFEGVKLNRTTVTEPIQ